jgi:hypothetical protein
MLTCQCNCLPHIRTLWLHKSAAGRCVSASCLQFLRCTTPLELVRVDVASLGGAAQHAGKGCCVRRVAPLFRNRAEGLSICQTPLGHVCLGATCVRCPKRQVPAVEYLATNGSEGCVVNGMFQELLQVTLVLPVDAWMGTEWGCCSSCQQATG